MKNYTTTEAAVALGVSVVSINNWIKGGEIIPSKTATGQPYFTEDQLVNLFLKHNLGKGGSQAMRVLYIVNSSTKEDIEADIEICKTAQMDVAPDAFFIESIQTFFQRTMDKVALDAEDEEYRKNVCMLILQEISTRLNKYVSNKVDTLYSINRKYKDFTRNELEAVVMGDKSLVTDELKARFDAILQEAKDSQDSVNMTSSGEYKKCRELPASFLECKFSIVLSELKGKFGLGKFSLSGVDIHALLEFADYPFSIESAKLFEKLLSSDITINFDLPEVKKLTETLTQKYTKGILQAQLGRLKKVGCYYIFVLQNDDMNSIARLFSMLELNTFTQVVAFKRTADKLPDAIKIKLDAGAKANKFRFDLV